MLCGRRASRHSAASVRPTTRMAIDSSGTTTLEISSTEVPYGAMLGYDFATILACPLPYLIVVVMHRNRIGFQNAWSGNPTGTGNGPCQVRCRTYVNAMFLHACGDRSDVFHAGHSSPSPAFEHRRVEPNRLNTGDARTAHSATPSSFNISDDDSSSMSF